MFGDSLSDTGKMYDKMRGYLPSSPPYHQGRFSNGPSGWSSSPSRSGA